MADTQHDITKPLAGLKVIELSTMVSASFATMILAAQGADVLKIEPVGMGDPMRMLGSQKGGISALFANCNRGKKSLALNLKDPEGVTLVKTLAKDADVLIHNYRPGVMEKLGLGSQELRAQNEKLIYVGITGFGTKGPLAGAPAYDHVVQGLSGYTSVQAEGDAPQFMKTLIVDKVTAYTAAQSITSALLLRMQTGKGQHIDVSMLQSGLFFLFPDGMMNETLKDEDVVQTPPLSQGFVAVPTLDGHVAMAPSTDQHWIGMGHAIARPDLADDPRFNSMVGRAQNYEDLFTIVFTEIAKVPTSKVIEELSKNDVPCAPCLSPGATLEHEQVLAIGAVSKASHPVLGDLILARPPYQFSGLDSDIERPCPTLGQHSEEIAKAAGFEPARVEEMKSRGALGA